MANTLETIIVAYICGTIVGSFSLIFLIGYILVSNGDYTLPDWYVNVHESIEQTYYLPEQSLFTIFFFFGIMSGLGGTGSAVNTANNRRNQN